MTVRGTDRGQAYTLEGVAAAILVVSALLFSLQAVVLTPTTPGTIDRDTRAELSEQGTDVLVAAHDNGSLSRAARYWNTTTSLQPNRTFFNPNPDEINTSRERGYGLSRPPGEFGAMLNQTFAQRGLTYNVYFEYRMPSDPTRTGRVVFLKRGVPTDNAVSASVSFTLYDEQRVTAPVSTVPGVTGPPPTLENATNFYVNDSETSSPVYNVITVRVVLW